MSGKARLGYRLCYANGGWDEGGSAIGVWDELGGAIADQFSKIGLKMIKLIEWSLIYLNTLKKN
ncbi:hypothetical protein [Euhalothece natronophila]|uniref:hypothetical protein n=1 Tax=Euhalothece natronophila TaxID=577489 RepID=UPI001647E3C1|nr:hypothetical protein [Euhalothece natronophila]